MIIPVWAAPVIAVALSTAGFFALLIWSRRIDAERQREKAPERSVPAPAATSI